jgi:mannosyl-glycoprotein endo-beta-N-acetylglucosaminidase
VAVVAGSRLLHEPRASAGDAMAHLAAAPDTGEYVTADWRYIAGEYWSLAAPAGVDPLIAFAQCMHETGNLSSWWAARPRRNPAGIGVTGEPGKGVSFPSWHHSVRAHMGRLCAYALPFGAGTSAQRLLIAEAGRWRAIPSSRRGVATTIAKLEGTWSVGDPNYSEALVAMCNRVAGAAGRTRKAEEAPG